MHELLPILLILLFVSCAFGFFLQHVFLSQLRSRHSQKWEALGRPTLFLNNSIANGLAVQRFLWRGEYRALGDRTFARLGNFMRVYMAAYLALFVLIIAVFMMSYGSWE